jgi:hypothetical protein
MNWRFRQPQKTWDLVFSLAGSRLNIRQLFSHNLGLLKPQLKTALTLNYFSEGGAKVQAASNTTRAINEKNFPLIQDLGVAGSRSKNRFY